MKVIIEAPFQLDEQKRKALEDQVADLEKYHMNITQADVFFKKDDGTITDGILAEIQLRVPGPVIFASDNHTDYWTAFTGALNKAERQLRKAKDVTTDHYN